MKPVQFLDLGASGRADEYLVSRDESPVTCVLYLLVVTAHHDRIGAVARWQRDKILRNRITGASKKSLV